MAPEPRLRANSVPKRAFSLPEQTDALAASSESLFVHDSGAGGEKIQVLFSHTCARIVNFSFSPAPAQGQLLSWSSPSERTIASGPLRIYKTIPHDIAFLQSGSALRPLLSKTQCWNIDGKKTFCLQLRPDNYWRIEMLGVEFEQAVKGAEFRNAMSKIVAFEITACPFVRAEDCAPVTESPDVLLPAKVWKRPPPRKVDRKTKDDPVKEGRSISDRLLELQEPLDFESRPTVRQSSAEVQSRIGVRRSSHEETPISFQERRTKYEAGGLSLSRSNPEHLRQVSLVSQRHKSSRNLDLVEVGRRMCKADLHRDSQKHQDQESVASYEESEADAPFLDDYGLELGDDRRPAANSEAFPERHSVAPFDHLVKTTDIVAPDEGLSIESPPGSRTWQDFTPPSSPSSAQHQELGVSPQSMTLPINSTAARGPPSRQAPSPAQALLPDSVWYASAVQPEQSSIHERRDVAVTDLASPPTDNPSLSAISTPVPSTEFEFETGTVITQPRPPPNSFLDPQNARPQLRRVASSFVLSRTAHIAAAANYVVLKPSAFLIAMMFSMATRIAARAVTGAAYSLVERGELGRTWDDELELDDFDACSTWEERKRRASEARERKAWGLEE